MCNMWKIGGLLLCLTALACDAENQYLDQGTSEKTRPCGNLIQRLNMCLGGNPHVIGECNDESAKSYEHLPCEDLLRALKGE